MATDQQQRATAAYRRLKEEIDRTHPAGWFVAIFDEQVYAAAADFHELEGKLRSGGKDARSALIVQAGVEYPEHVTIFI